MVHDRSPALNKDHCVVMAAQDSGDMYLKLHLKLGLDSGVSRVNYSSKSTGCYAAIDLLILDSVVRLLRLD